MTQTDQNQAKKTDNDKEVTALFVRSRPKSFIRAGITFNDAGFGVAVDALSKEQIKSIRDEKLLVVEERPMKLGELHIKPKPAEKGEG